MTLEEAKKLKPGDLISYNCNMANGSSIIRIGKFTNRVGGMLFAFFKDQGEQEFSKSETSVSIHVARKVPIYSERSRELHTKAPPSDACSCGAKYADGVHLDFCKQKTFKDLPSLEEVTEPNPKDNDILDIIWDDPKIT